MMLQATKPPQPSPNGEPRHVQPLHVNFAQLSIKSELSGGQFLPRSPVLSTNPQLGNAQLYPLSQPTQPSPMPPKRRRLMPKRKTMTRPPVTTWLLVKTSKALTRHGKNTSTDYTEPIYKIAGTELSTSTTLLLHTLSTPPGYLALLNTKSAVMLKTCTTPPVLSHTLPSPPPPPMPTTSGQSRLLAQPLHPSKKARLTKR